MHKFLHKEIQIDRNRYCSEHLEIQQIKKNFKLNLRYFKINIFSPKSAIFFFFFFLSLFPAPQGQSELKGRNCALRRSFRRGKGPGQGDQRAREIPFSTLHSQACSTTVGRVLQAEEL